MADDPKSSEGGQRRAQRIVGDLAKRGEARARDLQSAAKEIADRSARSGRDLTRLVQKEIRRQVGALGLASRADVQRLEARIRKLEGRRSTTSKAKPRSKAKPSPKKRPST